MKSQDQLKDAVATYIIDILEDHDILLFGSGSTVNRVIKYIQPGMRAVASSLATSMTFAKYGFEEITLDRSVSNAQRVCIDGADLVLNDTHEIIKGHGGALLREKITWQQATKIFVTIDETKLADEVTTTIPVVVAEFGYQTTIEQLKQLSGINDTWIYRVDGLPYHTDDGHLLVHLTSDTDIDLPNLDTQLHQIAGVIETGIFLPSDFQSVRFIVGTQDGIQEI